MPIVSPLSPHPFPNEMTLFTGVYEEPLNWAPVSPLCKIKAPLSQFESLVMLLQLMKVTDHDTNKTKQYAKFSP